MVGTTAEAFQAWHDFYVLMGAAAATLIGAMFVVASIGASFLTEQSEPQTRVFMTPTVIHLGSVLLGCGLAMVPSLDGPAPSICFGIGGIAGLVYSGRIALDVGGRPILLVDRIWYGIVPTVAYALGIAAAALMVEPSPGALETLAVGLVLLLVASVRNSWDLIVFYAQRTDRPG